MAAQIQGAYREQMNEVAAFLDAAFNGIAMGADRKVGFLLLVSEFGKVDGGRVNYISNGDRETMVAMLKEILARFEGRASDTPGHA